MLSSVVPNYVFNNPHIKELPPQRDFSYIVHCGFSSRDVEYCLELDSVAIGELRECLRSSLDVPTLLGNWDLMNVWIGNMWEALYNPIWLWLKPGGGFGIIHGHHRFRLLNKMDVERVWFYGLDARHYKIGKLMIPADVRQLMQGNDRAPRRGTVSGVCESCGERTRWSLKTFDRVTDVRMFCKVCGAENPYPWPGQI